MSFRRLIPHSLFFQLALLLVLAFSTLHLVSYVTMVVFAERYVIQNALASHNTAIALCLRLLDPSSHKTEQHALMIKSLSSLPDLNVSFSHEPPPFLQGEDKLSLFLQDNLQTLLRGLSSMPNNALRLRTEVSIARSSFDNDAPPPGLWQRIYDALKSTRTFQARIAMLLPDGDWLTLSYAGTARRTLHNVPQAGLALEALLLVGIVLFFMHRVMRPLRDLVQAADTFGTTLEPVSPVPLQGPAEIQRAAQAFNLMQQRIASGLEENARVFAALSHDLRTPLTRLRLRLEGVTPDELREKMLEDIRSLSSIVENSTALMQLPQRNAARAAMSLAPPVRTDIQAFLEAIVEDRRDMGAEVTLESTLVCFALVHPVPLRRCLDNLLDNALRYGKDVRVRAWQTVSPNMLHIEVLDNGPGLPEDCLDKVFEPFFRMEGSRSRQTGGSGLGLSIARSMLQLHGGTVNLRNRPEGGLCATILLPLTV